jgi:undecaprenyl-diphosphatase
MLLKAVFGRSRPGVVPHLSHVESASFPSAHSMMSAIVYLTVGLILAESVSNSRVRSLTVSVPLLLTLLVGISRIFMGVHYPSDVLAGWTAGIVWTMLAFHFNQFLISRGV